MSDKKTTTSTSTRLSYPIRGAAKEALTGARGLYRDPNSMNLPSAYVPMDPRRAASLDEIYSMASEGSMVPKEALGEWQKTVSGGYMDPNSNPWLREVVARSVGEANRAVRSQFGGYGRYGSGAYAGAAMDAATATASRIYGANYENERNRMLQYLGMTPTMAQAEYADPRMKQYVGQQYEVDAARQANEEIRQFMWPYQRQQIFESSVAGNPLTAESNTEQVTTQPFDWMSMVSGMLNPLSNMMDSMLPSINVASSGGP